MSTERLIQVIRVVAVLTLMYVFLWAATADASTGEVGCATGYIEWDGDEPSLVGRDRDHEDVRMSLVGTFLWLTVVTDSYGESSWDLHDQTVSVEVQPGDTEVTMCGPERSLDDEPIKAEEIVKKVATSGEIIIHSIVEPHPTIVDAWITSTGLVLR